MASAPPSRLLSAPHPRGFIHLVFEAILRGCADIPSVFSCFPQKLDAGNQLALIDELHKEIRLIGNESKGEHVPGFCLPKKVSQGVMAVPTDSVPLVPFCIFTNGGFVPTVVVWGRACTAFSVSCGGRIS